MVRTVELPTGLLVEPDGGGNGTGVLVLGGSSGRVERDRVRLLARHGVVAASIRWFGGEGQPPGICEVPLETFVPALDRLAGSCDRLAVLGTSKGAEAALLLAVRDPRVDAVAAFAAPHVVWANVGPGSDGRAAPYRSSWTWGGRRLPFVPYDDDWVPDGDPPAFRSLYDRSLETHAEFVPAASIPVEETAADLLLVAGDDDQVWSSATFARALADRRRGHPSLTRTVLGPGAGHRAVLPGESAVSGGRPMVRGGNDEADRALGRAAWRELEALLPLRARP